MNTTPSALGTPLSFWQVLERYALIEIPVLQRDYAQGRAAELDVREEFLDALAVALQRPADDPALPLNLDFVYGSVEPDGREAFTPLDGQQRLTTLFLLHWYLACVAGDHARFQAHAGADGHARFRYAVRPSSGEFFDALVAWCPTPVPAPPRWLSAELREQPWFFQSWELDPTIQSALTMLDALQLRIGQGRGLWARLIDPQRPAITLHLLDLQTFGLSDELYIKMNARGKPLTPFEHFKARFEDHLAALAPAPRFALHGQPATLSRYFSHQIDTAWADLLWYYGARQDDGDGFDRQFMRLLQLLALLTRPAVADSDKLLATLRAALPVPMNFRRLHSLGCLDLPLAELLVALLDTWSGSKGGMRPVLSSRHYDARHWFAHIVGGGTLETSKLLLWYAYCAYLQRHQPATDCPAFDAWMRVMVHLTHHSQWNDISSLRQGLAGIQALLPHGAAILTYLASAPSPVPGFSRQQQREEVLKAQLLLRNEGWRTRISAAEQHKYWDGQIEFLFKFCGLLDLWRPQQRASWDDATDQALARGFDVWARRATRLFGASGISAAILPLWQRALLGQGNYLLRTGKNHSFGANHDRDTGWPRLLQANLDDDGVEAERRTLFARLLGRMPESVLSSDDDAALAHWLTGEIAAAAASGDWREPFLRSGDLLDYCLLGQLRFQGPQRIYLMRRQRMSGEHAEAQTYYFYVSAVAPRAAAGTLGRWRARPYRVASGEADEPAIALIVAGGAQQLELTIVLASRQPADAVVFDWRLAVAGSAELPPRLAAWLVQAGAQANSPATWHWSAPLATAAAMLDQLAAALTEPPPSQD